MVTVQVLSRNQAIFTNLTTGVGVRDLGSSNGTFINNLRLGKHGQESEVVQIYSQDIIRY